jgi:TRAP-type C4-dicarboxylate transport system permease small subunit
LLMTMFLLFSYFVTVLGTFFSLMYIVFWTWLLNVLCNSGYTVVSWILVLLPFFFVLVALVVVLVGLRALKKKKEEIDGKNKKKIDDDGSNKEKKK